MKITNPIIPGFYPDPSIIRVGNIFYLANSTFEWFPGVAIHKSLNLKDWELVTYPLNTKEFLDLTGVPSGGGVWAPCLTCDKGMYYLVYSNVHTVEEWMKDTPNYVTMASSIYGPWSKPIYLNSDGFDASLFHDEDGTKWLVQMKWDFQPGHNRFRGIYLTQFDNETMHLKGEQRCIYRGTKRGYTEGPHLYKKDGYYYLMTAEGGTRDTHAITMARSKNLFGPYETDPNSPILTASDTPDYPIQYAGHGDLVDDCFGNWHVVHLGARRSLVHGYSVLGRETYLENGHWTEDGWFALDNGKLPQMEVSLTDQLPKEGKGDSFYHNYCFEAMQLQETVMVDGKQRKHNTGLDIHFSSLRIPLTKDHYSLTERPGTLRLYGREGILSKHNQVMVATRMQNVNFSVETKVSFTPKGYQQMAGLTLFYNQSNFYYCFISYEKDGITEINADGVSEQEKIDEPGMHGRRMLQIMERNAKKMRYVLKEAVTLPDEGDVTLGADVSPEGIVFYYMNEKVKTKVNQERLPLFILSDEYATESGDKGFTGAMIGMCCQDVSGARLPADFHYFNISRNE